MGDSDDPTDKYSRPLKYRRDAWTETHLQETPAVQHGLQQGPRYQDPRWRAQVPSPRRGVLPPSAVTAASSSLVSPPSARASTPRSPAPRRPSSAPTVAPAAPTASVTVSSAPS